MNLPIFQVDAFTDSLFSGNPAAVVPLDGWLTDDQMQNIAAENNLSETAFFVQEEDGFRLRWFTPTTEVDLCGHATLASAHVIFEELGFNEAEIIFKTKSGRLTIEKEEHLLKMNFPAVKMPKVEAPEILFKALGMPPTSEAYKTDDYMIILDSEAEINAIVPDMKMLSEIPARGVIITAKGDEVDFVSRFFAPQSGVDEDPVTGSAHTKSAPYWSKKLDKTELSARQVSRRGGDLICRMKGERVEILGAAITYLRGEISLG